MPGVERDARGLPTGRLFRADAWLRDAARRGRDPIARPGRRASSRASASPRATDATVDTDEHALRRFAEAIERGELAAAPARDGPPRSCRSRATRGSRAAR